MDGALSVRLAMQDYRNFPLYLTEPVWRDVLDTSNSSQFRRLEGLVRHLVFKLGLRHPSEITQAVVASVIDGGRAGTVVAQTSLLSTVKSVLKTAVTRAKQQGTPLPGGQYLVTLPMGPEQLPQAVRDDMAPNGFAPVPSHLDLNVLWANARGYPLRSTNRQVIQERQANQSNALGFAQPGFASAQMAGQVAAFAMSMAMSGALPMAGNSLGQVHAPAQNPQPNNGLARLLAGTQSHTVAPLLAITDGVVAPQPAAAQAAATEPSAEATPAPASVSPQQETPAGAAAALGQSVSEEDLSAQAPQSCPSRVEESVRALADAHYNEVPTLPDAPENGSKPKRQYVRKKPSAALKQTAVLHKPAAACAEKETSANTKAASKKRPAARALAHISRKVVKQENLVRVSKARRLRERPTGCATCRNTPGCCPSCWRKRGYTVD